MITQSSNLMKENLKWNDMQCTLYKIHIQWLYTYMALQSGEVIFMIKRYSTVEGSLGPPVGGSKETLGKVEEKFQVPFH